MTAEPPKEVFLHSLNRCRGDEGFIPAFYARFMAASDEILDKFRNTDFTQQNQMLLRSLTLAADATAGEPAACGTSGTGLKHTTGSTSKSLRDSATCGCDA